MKTHHLKSFARRFNQAFTLPELMISLSLMTLSLGGVIAANLFGLKSYQITKVKLGASDDARRTISKIVEEIKSAQVIKIGNGNQSGFTEISVGQPQQGSAVQIYPSQNSTTNWIRYYYSSNDNHLTRIDSAGTRSTVVGHSITNSLIFTSENFQGGILTDNHDNRVIGMKMEFNQIEYPVTPIGPGNFYDYYKLQTKITRRYQKNL